MAYLQNIFNTVTVYDELKRAVLNGQYPVAINGTGGVHKAHIAASMFFETGRKALFISPDEAEASRVCSDLCAMGLRCKLYPVRDFSFHPLEGRSREFERTRIEILCMLIGGELDAVVTVPDAAMQFTMPPEQLAQSTAVVKPGAELPMEQLISALTVGGYERVDSVEGAGQYSVRGGIIDMFPPACEQPVRVEFFGDEVDTVYSFDVESQRRCDPMDEVKIFPADELNITDPNAIADRLHAIAASLRGNSSAAARERLFKEAESLRNGIIPASCDKYLSLICKREATLLDYFGNDSIVYVSEHTGVKERASSAETRHNEEIKALLEDGVLCRDLSRYMLTVSELNILLSGCTIFMDVFAHGGFDVPLKTLLSVEAHQLPAWDGTVAQLVEDLTGLLESNMAIAVLAGSEKASDALCDDLIRSGIPAYRADQPDMLVSGKVVVSSGCFSGGFEYPTAGAAVISWGRSGGSRSRHQTKPKHKKGTEVQSLSELSIGDYIVHVTHGVGIFGGITKIESDGVIRDYIKITYAKNDMLYIPVTQLDMVSKYIGASEESGIKLSNLGGTDWAAKKSRVKKAVKNIAKELIKLYAQRMRAQGYPFDADTEFQRDFEARFEFDETDDQLRSIGEIKADMERPIPMERLLCGDVGFGKTEVALRAAFKCMVEGRQVALLAPTTILAWQHYQTALRRFEGFPFRIELLSRYRSAKQQDGILSELSKGRIDLIIGTHRIIQKDVKFHDLGLAIIDEEQRFGVAHKERFKEAFNSVDQLTLSATPIPRTLNMALSGLRDISTLDEAPQDRLPVQTYVIEYDPAVIADAIRRELRRGGQVYYLHNRVADIERVAARLHEMVPDAAIGIAHGQMTEQQISKEWKKLLDHETDILVCTTIIEAGVDVSNANTLIIEHADWFGLSQLHQIRGRVGRSTRRAYAYLTFDGRRELTDIARKRLSAIREFTQFGSGMKIAMRDLELRGAGNILGGEQSGHLDSVGYDLYMKLLNEAILEEKGEKPKKGVEQECSIDLQIEAHIPESYIEATTLRLDVYRSIAAIRSDEDALDVTDELIDRFGEPPKAVLGLIKIALIKNRAAMAGISEIKHNGGNLVFYIREMSDEDIERVGVLVKGMPGRVMLSMGSKAYFTVKIDRKLSIIENVARVLSIYAR